MTISPALFSSKTDQHATPQDLFDQLDAEFSFTLDVCADPTNAKCLRYYTEVEDGLVQPWDGAVWCNPPYGRGVGEWVQKAYVSILECAEVVVMLLPARTDTKWFHDYCVDAEVRFIKGRLKFGDATNCAPFPSMVVVWRAPRNGPYEMVSVRV